MISFRYRLFSWFFKIEIGTNFLIIPIILKAKNGIAHFGNDSKRKPNSCISLEGDHSFGVQPRFASYRLHLYCAAWPAGYLKFGQLYIKWTGMYRD